MQLKQKTNSVRISIEIPNPDIWNLRPAEFEDLDDEALKTILVVLRQQEGKFERKLKIPAENSGARIRFEEAVAKFDNGVLELSLPKVEKEEPKTIVID